MKLTPNFFKGLNRKFWAINNNVKIEILILIITLLTVELWLHQSHKPFVTKYNTRYTKPVLYGQVWTCTVHVKEKTKKAKVIFTFLPKPIYSIPINIVPMQERQMVEHF